MAKNDNLTDFLTDVADAIREKKGTTQKINPQEFSNEIKNIKTSSSIWTGHADVEGLKAIGWDDNDIAYFQEHGVNWDEEDDEYHKVPEDNKALYGVINVSNYKDYKDIIVYLPKFDMSAVSTYQTFSGFTKMVGIPFLNWGAVSQMYGTFYNCHQLTCVPPINTSKATRFEHVFQDCSALQYIPSLDSSSSTSFLSCFYYCASLREISGFSFDSAEQGKLANLFANSGMLEKVEAIIDFKGSTYTHALSACYGLKKVNIKNLAFGLSLAGQRCISKESVVFMIQHEAATSAITITLHAQAYAILADDPDIVAALAEHPLVSLASA